MGGVVLCQTVRYRACECVAGRPFQKCAEPWMAEPKRHTDVPQERFLERPSSHALMHPGQTTSPAHKASVFDTVLSRTGVGRKAFTARQHRSHTAHAVSSFRRKTDQGRSFLKIVNTQRRTEPGGTAGGQHMVRARAVVAKSFCCVATHEDGAGVANIIQHGLRIFYR